MRTTRAGKYEHTTGRKLLVPAETWEQEKANMRKERKFRKQRKRFKHYHG